MGNPLGHSFLHNGRIVARRNNTIRNTFIWHQGEGVSKLKSNDEDTEISEIIFAIEDFSRAAAGFDILLASAVDSGVESGRMLGLLEAYDHLVKKGYASAASALKVYVDKMYIAPPPAKA